MAHSPKQGIVSGYLHSIATRYPLNVSIHPRLPPFTHAPILYLIDAQWDCWKGELCCAMRHARFIRTFSTSLGFGACVYACHSVDLPAYQTRLKGWFRYGFEANRETIDRLCRFTRVARLHFQINYIYFCKFKKRKKWKINFNVELE